MLKGRHYRKFFDKILAETKIVCRVARRGFLGEKLIRKIIWLKGRHYRKFLHKIQLLKGRHYRKFFHKIVAKIKRVRSVARRGFPEKK